MTGCDSCVYYLGRAVSACSATYLLFSIFDRMCLHSLFPSHRLWLLLDGCFLLGFMRGLCFSGRAGEEDQIVFGPRDLQGKRARRNVKVHLDPPLTVTSGSWLLCVQQVI